jgi:hypothetical protein
MAKKKKTASKEATAKAPAFPKAMVKVTRNADGGYDVAEQIVTDADAEKTAAENGFHPVEEIVTEPEIVEYPAWRYHRRHGSKIVQSEAEDEKLGAGWEDHPYVAPETDEEPVGITEPELEEDR